MRHSEVVQKNGQWRFPTRKSSIKRTLLHHTAASESRETSTALLVLPNAFGHVQILWTCLPDLDLSAGISRTWSVWMCLELQHASTHTHNYIYIHTHTPIICANTTWDMNVQMLQMCRRLISEIQSQHVGMVRNKWFSSLKHDPRNDPLPCRTSLLFGLQAGGINAILR